MRLQLMGPGLIASGLAVLVWVGPLRLSAYRNGAITDIPTYHAAADRIADGLVPYRDFDLEYPPLAAAVFALPRILPGDYDVAFSALMLVALVATVIATVFSARVLGLTPVRQLAAGCAVALSPLALGLLMETRYDLVLAAVLAWLVVAALTERWRAAWILLALGVLLKLVPLLLIPLLVVYQLHRQDMRSLRQGAATGLAVVVAALVPVLIAAPAGFWESLRYHLDRPLQIESTAAAYLLSLHALADVPLRVQSSFGSQGLIGDGPRALAAISAVIAIIGIFVIAIALRAALRRSHPALEGRLFVAAVAATLAVMLASGKVLSPQFVIWLLPVGFIVSGKYGWATFATTAAAIIATGAYFPRMYWDLVALDDLPIALLVLRDALLVGLVAAAWPRASIGRPPGSVELPLPPSSPHSARSTSARYLSD